MSLGTSANLSTGEVQTEIEISAAHWLPFHKGKCKNLHGHNYRFVVIVAGYFSIDDAEGAFILDFDDLKEAMREVIMPWDHALLLHHTQEEAVKALQGSVEAALGISVGKIFCLGTWTTAENLAYIAASRIEERIRANDIIGVTVECWETTKCCARVSVPSEGGLTQ